MKLLADILTYPFRGSGIYIFIIGSVIGGLSALATYAPLIGAIAVLLLTAYFCSIYFEIIQSTAAGDSEAPAFPDTTNIISDMIWPMLQVVIVLLASFGPFIAYQLWFVEDGHDPMIGYGLLGFGVLYFPMAMLAVVVLGSIWCLSPHIVIPGIFRGGLLYWLSVLLLCLLYAANFLIEVLTANSVIVSMLVTSILSMYTLMVNGRVLGIVYREREEQLGWL